MDQLLRAASAILRTNRPLSADFREQAASLIDALDQLVTETEIVEQAHKKAAQPFYSKGLEMTRAATEKPGEK